MERKKAWYLRKNCDMVYSLITSSRLPAPFHRHHNHTIARKKRNIAFGYMKVQIYDIQKTQYKKFRKCSVRKRWTFFLSLPIATYFSRSTFADPIPVYPGKLLCSLCTMVPDSNICDMTTCITVV